jgi:excisionase family DNA binding protein
MPESKRLSVAEAAQELQVSKMTIYRWTRSRKGKPPKIASEEEGGLLFIPRKEIDRVKNGETSTT